ncbi:LXG domain-containing protein [Salipaludibacillus sp. LMS25]|jgi:archaellum component FlaC|uniref:ribonuclease YeeF family protein n=1 Tax=Salipaludibacillus sp. LMS25 TaxID=2924031 RepID=UPI0020D1AD99|nr:LXG domain-containing protein [Salipaludibacillus sp. LMS25]UTR14966.1 LXG domain-containing protein [Salipaludibacillus sp. LMS25]
MKLLDIQALNEDIDVTKKEVHQFQEKITTLQQAVQDIVALDDALTGQGGEAIKSFYNDCHQTFLTYLTHFTSQFTSSLDQMKDAVASFEPNNAGYINETVLQNDVDQGLTNVANTAASITADVNDVISRISDIVSLQPLDASEVIEDVNRGKKSVLDVVEKLHALDESQAASLQTVKDELATMKNYVTDLGDKFESGAVSITSFNASSLQNIAAYQQMTESIEQHASIHGEELTPSEEAQVNDTVEGTGEKMLDFDPTEYLTAGNLTNRVVEGLSYKEAHNLTKQGFAIKAYKTKSGEIKYRVYKPQVAGIRAPKKGRTTKLYSKSFIDSMKIKNAPKVGKFVSAKVSTAKALGSKAGWLGTAVTAGLNMNDNIENGASTSKIIGDVAVDVGIGALSIAGGAVLSAAAVGSVTFGAPVVVGAAISIGVSLAITTAFDAVKINGKSLADHTKDGVQKVGTGIKNGAKAVAGWFKKKK